MVDEDGNIRKEHIKSQRQSVYRESLCRSPEDVLLDEYAGVRHEGWGIFGFRYGDVNGFTVTNDPQPKQPHYKFDVRIEHDPTPCAYPHCEVRIYRTDLNTGEELIPNDPSRRVKTEYRDLVSRMGFLIEAHNLA